MKLALVIFFTLITLASAFSAPGEMDTIKEGEPAQYDGFTIDSDRADYFRQINEEKKLAEEKALKEEQLRKINESETEYYKETNKDLRKELDKEDTKKNLIMVGAFGVGVVMTCGIGYLIFLLIP